MRTRPLPYSEYADPVQSQMSERAAGLQLSHLQCRAGKALFIGARADKGFITQHTCVALVTLLPALPFQREPIPAGKVFGVIL